MAKFVLYLAGATFTAYGLACLLSPGIAAGAAGLSMQNADAIAEVGAMYGGFQTGFGVFCLFAAWQPEYRRAGLWALLLGIGLLGGRSQLPRYHRQRRPLRLHLRRDSLRVTHYPAGRSGAASLAVDDIHRHLEDVDGEATARRLLVLVLHIATGVAHGLDHLVE